MFPYNTFATAAGHGGGDSGATYRGEREDFDAIQITQKMASTLILHNLQDRKSVV